MPDYLDEARDRVRAAAGALRLATDSARAEQAEKGAVSERLWILCDRLHDTLSTGLGELERAERQAGLR